MFVEPKSNVCRTFERELNANCGDAIPIVEFKPRPTSGLVIPAWTPIELYGPDGKEVSAAFDLLEKLSRARAISTYFTDREQLALRDAGAVLTSVREAHGAGKSPRFERVSLDIEGLGQEEAIYRLYSGQLENPLAPDVPLLAYKIEPNLFLERALSMVITTEVSPVLQMSFGKYLSGRQADILMFDGVPYFLTWESNRIHVYAAYLYRNRVVTPEEQEAGRRAMVPTLRCRFDWKPAAK